MAWRPIWQLAVPVSFVSLLRQGIRVMASAVLGSPGVRQALRFARLRVDDL